MVTLGSRPVNVFARVDANPAVIVPCKRFAALLLEMVYRSLYFFTGAYQRGEASDPVAYLAAKAEPFGIIKRQRKKTSSQFQELKLPLAPEP